MKIKHILKLNTLAIIIIFLNIGLYPTHKTTVFAQDSTSSGAFIDEVLSPTLFPTILPDPEPTITSIESLNLDTVISTSSAPIISPTPILLDNKEPLNSAIIEPPSKVYPLEKKVFQANEKIKLTMENIDTSQMKLSIKNNNGEEVPVYFVVNRNDKTQELTIESTNKIKPGKYTLTVVDSNGQETVQEFTWGVLAINTNKSIYLPGETVNFAMAVLDDAGRTVCNADTVLEITNPKGDITTLSTTDGTIKVNSECLIYDVNENPDYEATYITGETGEYSMVLNAKTNDGEHVITDRFEVKDSVDFDIERTGPTRIYVPEKYQMNFKIKFNQDFKGEINEFVPKSFTLYPIEGRPYDSVDVVVNKEKISSIDTINLAYPFNGDFPYTQRFGVEETDPLMKQKYEEFGLKGHDGIDFEMPAGTPILAIDEGEVVLAEDWDYGQTIIIQHSWGKSYYGHLSELKVVVGQQVRKGELIGLSGESGLATGPHLHLGIKLNKHNQNNGYYGKISPLSYLGKPAQITDFSVKKITWKIDVKAGESFNFGYEFLTPSVSPAFYLLGRLQLVETNQNLVFKELRKWQIAADASDILYPAADVAIGTWTDQSSGTTNLWDTINEGTVSYNDSDYAQCALSCTNDQFDFSHTSSLSDVGTVTAITVRFRGQRSKNKTTTINVYYCASPGCTPSTAIGTTQTMTDSWAPYSVTASSLSISKTNIDNLRVRLSANSTAGARAQVSAAQVDLTYDPVVTGPTLDQLMRHGKWFNSSGVKQPFVF